MNRIEKLFKEKKENVLSIYYTAGYPKLDSTLVIAKALEKAGVDLIEIGIPFSDPVADGPTIQESNKVALRNGMTVKLLLEQVKEIKREVSVPIILMGYLNPVLQYGFEEFCEAVTGSADGLILPDMPLVEFDDEYKSVMTKYGLLNIFLIAPTTSERRIRKIDSLSEGFIYAVSASSTTGTTSNFSEEQEEYFKRLKSMNLKNPFLVGFGVSNHETFSTASKYGSGAIIGSAFIKLLGEAKNLDIDIGNFVKEIRGKVPEPVDKCLLG